jgi:hypothetical protein
MNAAIKRASFIPSCIMLSMAGVLWINDLQSATVYIYCGAGGQNNRSFVVQTVAASAVCLLILQALC